MSDQASNLRRELARTKTNREAKTISIVSGKGGVGKSNFAINFSMELINNRKKVLLFDLDVGMGNVDILLGLHASKTIIDMLNDRLPIQDIIETDSTGLAYIAGGSAVNDFFTMNQTQKEYFFQQYNQLIDQYDYIIFDMGAGVSEESIFFILASDECIVLTTPEPTSITDSYSMIKHIINKQENMPIYVVMNRSQTERSGHQALTRFKDVIMQFLHIEINPMGILPEDKIVSQAVMRQTPYTLLNKRAAISRSLKKMTDKYLDNEQAKSVAMKKPLSFIQKLKQLLKER